MSRSTIPQPPHYQLVIHQEVLDPSIGTKLRVVASYTVELWHPKVGKWAPASEHTQAEVLARLETGGVRS